MSISPAPSFPPTGALPGTESASFNSVTKRYVDAYRVANLQTRAGGVIKFIAGIIGGLIALVSLGNFNQANPFQAGFAMLGLLAVVMIGGLGFILGLLISANGQILKATLDGAVNSSPFLSNHDRAGIMSL